MPVELAYKTYEVKNGKPDKSPLVIHHSLFGRFTFELSATFGAPLAVELAAPGVLATGTS